MREAGKYKVYSGGAIEAGFEVDDVVSGFATLFKVSQDQASAYVVNNKLIKKDLSESDAKLYREKIKGIGLIAQVIRDKAANDESVSVEPKTGKPPTPQSNAAAEAATPQLVCPKCSLMQPKSEECTKCGLIFSKYRDPNYRPKPEASESESDSGETDIKTTGIAVFVGVINKHKKAVLFCMVLLSVLVGSVVTLKTGNFAAGSNSGSTFTQKNKASAKVKELMIAADLNSTFKGLDKNLEQLFSEQFPGVVKHRGGSEESALFVVEMLPNAFNADSGSTGLANWLQLTLKDNELDKLIALYQTYIVREATELSKALEEGSPLHQSFLSSYDNNPPGPRRRQALEKLVDVTALDEFFMLVWAEGQAMMMTLAASTAPDFNTNEGREKTSQSIRDMRDMLPFVQGPIREEAIKNLAWQLDSYDLMELQALGRALDTPEARNLFKEMRRGVKTHIEDATAWLAAMTARRAGNI